MPSFVSHLLSPWHMVNTSSSWQLYCMMIMNSNDQLSSRNLWIFYTSWVFDISVQSHSSPSPPASARWCPLPVVFESWSRHSQSSSPPAPSTGPQTDSPHSVNPWERCLAYVVPARPDGPGWTECASSTSILEPTWVQETLRSVGPIPRPSSERRWQNGDRNRNYGFYLPMNLWNQLGMRACMVTTN